MHHGSSHYEVSHDSSGTRSYAKTMAAESGGQIETRTPGNLVHHRNDIRRDVNHASPGFFDSDIRKLRQAPGQPQAHLSDRFLRWRGIEHTRALERTYLIILPTSYSNKRSMMFSPKRKRMKRALDASAGRNLKK